MDFKRTDIYQWDMLLAGNVIDGPAVIEADNTTVVIEPGWTFTMTQELYGVVVHNI